MASEPEEFQRLMTKPDFTGKVRSVDTWGHLNAEDSVEISPAMFREFVLPYQKRLAKEFGQIYGKISARL